MRDGRVHQRGSAGPVVFVVVLLGLLAFPLATAHAPGVPGRDARDDLALVEREWRISESALQVFTLDGAPYDPRQPDVAFRFHADAMLVEGALVVPDPGRDAPPPAYSVGVRLVDVTLDPPLALDDGAALGRILLGPLAWRNVIVADRSSDGHTLETEAEVPWPGGDGVSPATDAGGTRATGVRLTVRLDVVGRPAPGAMSTPGAPPEGFLSPAEVRLHIFLDAPRSLDAPIATRLQLGTLFDFIHPTLAWRAPGGDRPGWEGLYLARGDRFAHLAGSGTGHAITDRDGVLASGGSVVRSPVSFNVTGQVQGDRSSWWLALGFQMPQDAWWTESAPDAAGTRRESAVPSAVVLLAPAIAGLAFLRRRP